MTLEREFDRQRAETDWRQRYRGSDHSSDKALREWEQIQRRYDERPERRTLPSSAPGRLAPARVRTAEDDAPRGGSTGGSSVPVDRKIIELSGNEVRITDSTGAEIDRWVEWTTVKWEDVNGNQWTDDLNTAARTENITPAP